MGKKLAYGVLLASLLLNACWLWPLQDWRVLPALLLGWYLADLVSGIIHAYMDYRPCQAGVGLDKLFFYEGSRESEDYLHLRASTLARINGFERVVFDFKNHHPRPDALGRRDMLHLIGVTVAVGALPLSLLLNAINLCWHVPVWLNAACLSFLVGSTFAQYFHSTLHRPQVNALIRLMRKAGLLMTPAAHQKHHDSLQKDFSTNCGWSNPLVNRVFTMLRRRGAVSDIGLIPPP